MLQTTLVLGTCFNLFVFHSCTYVGSLYFFCTTNGIPQSTWLYFPISVVFRNRK
ncbi:hypothetical protein Lal_00001348 [Lupinus albus]|nr:hypothetical protein Lal_00001348 [Lupinus albus]